MLNCEVVTLHRFTRYSQIADIFIKYGFGMVLEGFIPGLPRLPRIWRGKAEEEASPYVRIRMMIGIQADVSPIP